MLCTRWEEDLSTPNECGAHRPELSNCGGGFLFLFDRRRVVKVTDGCQELLDEDVGSAAPQQRWWTIIDTVQAKLTNDIP